MTLAYVGSELELFAAARNWKAYLKDRIGPWIAGDVLEVGAGLGETARSIRPGSSAASWTALEPDPALCAAMAPKIAGGELGDKAQAINGTLHDIPAGTVFDTVMYIDVVEHIADDRGELARAVTHLRPGGRLVVLAPAFNFLFSPFDAAIGHYRRYDARSLTALAPPGCTVERRFYLDSVGFLASAANRFLMRQAMPTRGQIAVWDRLMVPLSRWLDPLVGRWLGKSIVVIWRKT